MVEDLRWMKRCPRFEGCSANCCPLDPLNAIRGPKPGDRRQRCGEPLRSRLAVVAEAKAAGVEIAGGGLTRWEARSGKPLAVLLTEDDARWAAVRERWSAVRRIGRAS